MHANHLTEWYMDAGHVPQCDAELGLVKSRIRAFIIWLLWHCGTLQLNRNTNPVTIRNVWGKGFCCGHKLRHKLVNRTISSSFKRRSRGDTLVLFLGVSIFSHVSYVMSAAYPTLMQSVLLCEMA